jgi:hypothetical protein
MLKVCEDYNEWLANGGRIKAAKLAARNKKTNLNSVESIKL